ncbi:unnamed protein product, partial [Cylicostephanus goldi]
MLRSMWNSSEIDEAYANMTHVSTPSPPLAIVFAVFTLIGIVGNLTLFLYILIHKLYQNFISSHFIAHLCITNLVALLVLLPVFIYTVWTGVNVFKASNFMCRLQVRKLLIHAKTPIVVITRVILRARMRDRNLGMKRTNENIMD